MTSVLHLAINGEAAELAYGVDPGIESLECLSTTAQICSASTLQEKNRGIGLRRVDTRAECPVQARERKGQTGREDCADRQLGALMIHNPHSLGSARDRQFWLLRLNFVARRSLSDLGAPKVE